MMARRYPQEVRDFLREYIPGHSAVECCDEVKRRFDYDITPAQMKSFKCNIGVKSGTKFTGKETDAYSPEVRRYIAENYIGVGPSEMADRLNSLFGTAYTRSQIKGYYGARHLDSGLTGRYEKGHESFNAGKKGLRIPGSEKGWFKDGHTPYNKVPIGTVLKKCDGYLWKKTGEGARDWRQLHILVWEEAHGPLKPGEMVTFLDGNHENVVPENLMLIDNEINGSINHMRCCDGEYTKAAILVKKISREIKNREDKKK